MFRENVQAKKCLWCGESLSRDHRDGKNLAVICSECKLELKRLKLFIGREEWLKLIKDNKIDKLDIYSTYKDYL